MNTSNAICLSYRRGLSPLLAAVVAVGGICATPYPAEAGLLDLIFQSIRVIQLANLSDEEEIEMGQQINAQIVQEVAIYDNPTLTRYVNGITQSLAQGSRRPQINYTVQIVKDDSINAFATVGGFIYIHTGLLRAADNEAQLASVIAHEMGHIEKRHVIQQIQQAAIAEGILSVGGIEENALIDLGVELALHRPNSREHEFEADTVGLELLKNAGYAPIASVNFLKKLLDQTDSTPEFLSTHPDTEDRILALEQSIEPEQASVGRGLDSSTYSRRINFLLMD